MFYEVLAATAVGVVGQILSVQKHCKNPADAISKWMLAHPVAAYVLMAGAPVVMAVLALSTPHITSDKDYILAMEGLVTAANSAIGVYGIVRK